jgi:hypothetical protein
LAERKTVERFFFTFKSEKSSLFLLKNEGYVSNFHDSFAGRGLRDTKDDQVLCWRAKEEGYFCKLGISVSHGRKRGMLKRIVGSLGVEMSGLFETVFG